MCALCFQCWEQAGDDEQVASAHAVSAVIPSADDASSDDDSDGNDDEVSGGAVL